MIMRKATDADLNTVVSLAQNIFEQEQRIPKSLTYIPPKSSPNGGAWSLTAKSLQPLLPMWKTESGTWVV